MAYTDFIAAIDLGSSHMVGMVGTKGPSGALSIIAYEVENSETCIRRGCVYNVEGTAFKIKRLIQKLETKLHGAKIGKVYVGIGGQSLRTIDHTVPKILGAEGVVTEDIIQSLYKECTEYHPDMLDVLGAVSPVYFLDDKPEPSPVGIPCSRIEARYKLLVGRPSLRRYVTNSIADRAKIEIADIIVSPLALADVVLTENEKDLGCALIGFGGGVTTLTVYKGGNLVNLSVIPFGGNLITRDITDLHLVEAEAERVKLTYGSAMMDRDNEMTIQVSSADGLGLREIKLADLNNVVEARIKEILENVYSRLEATGLMNALGAGIVITGGGAALKNLPDVIRDRLKMDVRYSTVRKGIVENGEMVANNPQYAVAVGLLMKGTENCAYIPPKSPEPKFEQKVEEAPKEEPKKAPEPPKKKPEKKKGPGLFDRLSKGIDNFGKTLFDDEDNTGK
ncbi:cell division protein FtsA [Parabacteroides sp. AM08-6]|uniref:cell division protein FtsA n=1 Tax=Parabacteroides sp. AM08-6 TaxID=2292053 RepID=UPI000EFFA400|nr:cell division protein FtsA [Parabacteroides sp. AM08-6]RHJ82429.1 cell division protein FtsA [Parabacteroides sp. AM08-6]